MTAAVCRDCRRPLTARASVARGYGPSCWAARRPDRPQRTASVPTPARPDVDPAALEAAGQIAIPVQPVLPLTPHHPPVWRGRVQAIPTGDLL